MGDISLFTESPYTTSEIIFKDDQGNWPRMESFNQEIRLNGYSIGFFFRNGVKSGIRSLVKVEHK